MKIDKDNCEAYFLDYYEGNLSKEGVEELFAFLALNPDMRELFDSYEELSFSPEKNISFEGKADLKKSVEPDEGINESNYEEYFVSEVEGLLSAEEKLQIKKFIAAHPEKGKELEILRATILTPDTSVVFEHKSSLTKSILVSEANFEEQAIASIEGLLNQEEQKAFVASLSKNPEQQKAFEVFLQTKLSPDSSIVFEDKESLKRRENDRGGLWWMRDIRFAAAAAVILFAGIFYWNSSGKTDVKVDDGHGTVAKVDSVKKNQPAPVQIQNNNVPVTNSNQNVANNTNENKKHIKTIKWNTKNDQLASNNSENKKHIKTIKWNTKVADEKTPFTAVAVRVNSKPLKTNVNPQVNFSDEYYNYTEFSSGSPVASNSISVRQAAMRWMKNKLDHSSTQNDDDEMVMASYNANNSTNGDVTGFDLTSSAVNRIGEATGANIHLGKEEQGTILTVGKYRVLLNRKH
jgi:hypothetical protein